MKLILALLFIFNAAEAAVVRDPQTHQVVRVRESGSGPTPLRAPDLSGRWKLILKAQPEETAEVEIVPTPDCNLPTKATGFLVSSEGDKLLQRGIALYHDDALSLMLTGDNGYVADITAKKVGNGYQGTADVSDDSRKSATYPITLTPLSPEPSQVRVLPIVANFNSLPRKDDLKWLLRAPSMGSRNGSLVINAKDQSAGVACYNARINDFHFINYVYAGGTIFTMKYIDAKDPSHPESLGFVSANAPTFQASPLLFTQQSKDGITSLEIIAR